MVRSSSEPGLHEGFLKSAARSPGRPALCLQGNEYSYETVRSAAFAYARALTVAGVGRGDRVGLLLDKSLSLYAGLLGTLMVGAAYVPLAPSYPASRLRLILDQAQPKALLYASGDLLAKVLPDPAPGLSLLHAPAIEDNTGVPFDPAGVDPRGVAYILFTSGSTGVPKGVMISHANACAFVDWAVGFAALVPGDRLSGHSDLNFDLSVFDTFATWKAGACLVPVVEMMDRTTPSRFINTNRLTVWFSVPSVLSSMTAMSDLAPENLAGLRLALFCGEPLLPGPVRALMTAAPQLRVANLYGPTEATVACSAYELTAIPAADVQSIPIGWKTAGTHIFVWHDDQREAADGETGEIHIAGDQVALGYFRRDDESKARFIEDPRFPGEGRPCYRTGDIGLVSPEGPVFRGRLDHQVKFRGWRIELGDIEQALAQIAHVTECACAVIRREGKTDALVAFVRLSSPMRANDIIARLRPVLPDYMIPTHVRVVEDFPRTLNGKIDRNRLGLDNPPR